MNFKKIVAAFAAAAMAVTMSAVSAFAATVEMDSEYTGSWSASKCIPKSELTAIGGDVKITLTLETRNLANTADQFLIRPMDYDNGWLDQTPNCTSDTVVAKTDGMFCIQENSTTCEFVISGDAVAALGESGLSFQVQNVIIKSAELEAGSPQGAIRTLDDAQGKEYCFGASYEELTGTAAPAETEAPAADSATTSTSTGNTAAASMAVVMVAAGAAALISKRK